MFNLIIVDDEEIVRNGLKKFVNWEELGFQVTGDMESALEALEFIENERVDAILTDIKMPDMDGLTLIEEIRTINSDIKTVILSGYGEFEYAQKAIRLGAYDFLTKPVKFEELKRIFLNISQILEEKEKEDNKKKEYTLLKKERFLNNLSKGFYSDKSFNLKRINEMDFALDKGNFCIIRVYICAMFDDSIDETEVSSFNMIKSEISEVLRDKLHAIGKCHIYNNEISELCILLYPNAGEDEIKKFFEKFQEDFIKDFKISSYIGIGNKYEDIKYLPQSYKEAGEALEYRILKKRSSVLFFSDVCRFFKGRDVVTDEVKANILLYLMQADEEKLIKYVEKLLREIAESENISVNILYDSCVEILLIVSKYIGGLDNSFYNSEIQSTTLKSLFEKDSFEDIRKYMADYITSSVCFIKSLKETTTGRVVENAKRYIEGHYSEDITLNKMSDILYVHPTYLCKLFKEKTGENFIDYLIRVRVEKAKQLLSDLSLKIYEISEMVGYESSKYFSKVFKEFVGVTPKEYRDSL